MDSAPPEREVMRRMIEEERNDGENSFDFEKTMARLGGNRELFNDLVKLCLQHVPLQMADVERAIQRKDAVMLEKTAHKLKGSLTTITQGRVCERAQRLERMGRLGDIENSRELFQKLAVDMNVLLSTLQEFQMRGSLTS